MDMPITTFTLIAKESDRRLLLDRLRSLEHFVEIGEEYSLGREYFVLQFHVLLIEPNELLYPYLFDCLPSIAFHQEANWSVVAKDGKKLIKMLKSCYEGRSKYDFVYDMLTSGERLEDLRLQGVVDATRDDRFIPSYRVIEPFAPELFSKMRQFKVKRGDTGDLDCGYAFAGYKNAVFRLIILENSPKKVYNIYINKKKEKE